MGRKLTLGVLVLGSLACSGVVATDPPIPDPPREGKGKAGRPPTEPELGEGDENDRPDPTDRPAARDGIAQVGPASWTVTRAKADALEERPGTIGDLAATPAGGWRFTRVGLDGAALGLLAGDVIREVNGYPLGSEVELAVAWAALRGASDFDVKIRRDGAARTHHVQILR